MQIEKSFHLTLTEQEATALKKVLGGLNDDQFRQFCGIQGEDRKLVGEIWNALPYREDENER